MDPNERKKNGINLPPTMTETSLRLEAFCSTKSSNFRTPTKIRSPIAMSPRAISNLSSSPSRKSGACSDRFIPCRSSSRLHTFGLINKSMPVKKGGRGHNEAYLRLLRTELFGSDFGYVPPGSGLNGGSSPNMLRFRTENSGSYSSPSILGHDRGFSDEVVTPPKPPRKVPNAPYKGQVQVLDAPGLQDDFYLNLVDWSSQNVVAVGLGSCVYLWTASNSKVTKLCDLGPNDSVCSVQWTKEGSFISIGTDHGQIQVWDGTECKKIRTFTGHHTRTGVLAWSSRILASGSKDKNILLHDLIADSDYVNRLIGHKSEVCGLKWSHNDRELASGGNDHQVLVWNLHSHNPVLRLKEHKAAVKAITWSPHQSGLLALGGGTADRCIRFWNTTNDNLLNFVDTGSQVCNLAWSKNVNEIVSTHGYSENQIMVWKYPSIEKVYTFSPSIHCVKTSANFYALFCLTYKFLPFLLVATLTGHAMRVLYLAMSPDGQKIVTGAGDETLRFWNVFSSTKAPAAIKDTGIWSLGRTHIR